MGAWGAGAFDNDTALDWVANLRDGDLSVVESALKIHRDSDGYIDAEVMSEAIAAADSVSWLSIDPADPAQVPGEVAQWLGSARALDTSGLNQAASGLVALARRPGKNELLELWEEAGSLDEYLGVLAEIEARLSGGAGSA